ncbi:polyprenyl synthetase family protein [Nocardia araoensis]|uniref:polyprenyl synthetase family protein n=1 Tax=Nocardia araoensis TaxID=228600 RepID=UPI0003136E80|nr:polyprenyl synthetase family protein [Nocardia araoensis]
MGSAAGAMFSGFDLDDSEFANAVYSTLEEVDERLARELAYLEISLGWPALVQYQGRGIRILPLLTILTGQMGPCPASPALTTAATAVELVHLATVCHGNVQDETSVRRDLSGMNSGWCNNVVILAGDYLSACASRLVSTLGPEAARIIAETFASVVTGQVREKLAVQPTEDPVERWLQLARERAGSLLGASARFGGLCSGMDPHHVERLARFGTTLGTALQISDNLVSDTQRNRSSDVGSGSACSTDAARRRQAKCTADGGTQAMSAGPMAAAGEVPQPLPHLDSVVLAKEMLRGYTDLAEAELFALPDGPANDALQRFVRHLADRVVLAR